ncbi:MAG: F0F1 ATP synthase subunit delta, partial [Candidatus Omnitrophica bacterium]|nr:F0F1 ATP synthase subunit delta [Candidatus Omnitrophota bacterium]
MTKIGMNWTDLAALSKTNVNWSDFEVLTTRGINWNDYAQEILNDILSTRVKEEVDNNLMSEFIEKLKTVDMSRISKDLTTADVMSANAIPASLLDELAKGLKSKLSRDIKLNAKVDPSVVGGVVLMFGSLRLDGSLHNALKESANVLKQKIERSYLNG